MVHIFKHTLGTVLLLSTLFFNPREDLLKIYFSSKGCREKRARKRKHHLKLPIVRTYLFGTRVGSLVGLN